MSFLELLFLAVALSVDAFSVAVVIGMKERCSIKKLLYVAGAFAFFQFLMPILGWYIFDKLQSLMAEYASWVAFILLSIVGFKMLWDGIKGRAHGPCKTCKHEKTLGNNATLSPLELIYLSVATSLDALAVGASFGSLGLSIWLPAIIIGAVCFCISALGVFFSSYALRKNTCFSCYANMGGGLVLVGIGLKILLT